MKKIGLLFAIALVIVLSSCSNESYTVKNYVDANGYNYQTVINDPYNLRIYKLENGLTVYLSVNKDEPRIQTFIPVKAGSTYDPADNTGLAHYLEHMMFKGTSKIGTINWEEEKVLIQKISDLYEAHKDETDPVKKKAIYKEIDETSQIAAKFAAANEYDKLIGSIGGKYTNAYTTNERTVYMNNIPSNELDKWLHIEAERFSDLVLRIFHTELETVYEEFNMGQDRDGTKTYFAMLDLLFPTHPYGQQTTIGKANHLKNPSMENIMKYWSTYYVPNNMAICLSGDFNHEQTIMLIDKTFGQLVRKDVPENILPKEEPITEVRHAEVYGPQAEFLMMAYRFDGTTSNDEKMVTLIDYMLSNSKAGLIDLNLNQEQKVLSAGCSPSFMKDYGMHYFSGTPREGQTLDEVKELILGEVNKIKTGEFDDELIVASINNMKLEEIQGQESNNRAHKFAISFANGISWDAQLKFNDELTKITKEQIMEFAKVNYTDNYVMVHKLKGQDDKIVKVEKPEITAVDLNRENESEFLKNILAQETDRLSPVFIDFNDKISSKKFAEGVMFSYIENPTNELFRLIYIVDMGKNNDKELALAVNYLPFLGTDKYSPAELQQEFFKYGLSFGVSTGSDRSYVYINGLEDNADKAVELLEHLLANVKTDSESYAKYVEGIDKKRADRKLDKNQILRGGMMNYAMYGKKSTFTDILSSEEMKNINPEILAAKIKEITSYEHQLFYYGQKTQDEAFALLEKYHTVPAEVKPIPAETVYPELAINKAKVYFVDYDMVQTQVMMLSKGGVLNTEAIPDVRLFNEFYGSGLSSIVFQEIRESRALAYSAYSYYTVPRRVGKSHYNISYVATQVDKLETATAAMEDLLNKMPKADKQFEMAKESIMKKIETERIIKDDVFWTYLNAQDKGLSYDNRKDVYEYMKKVNMDDFSAFFNTDVANKEKVYLVIGDKDKLDFNVLKSLGDIQELSLEQVFNY